MSNNIQNRKKTAHDAKFKVKYNDSNRHKDDNGYLHIKECVLTAEEVSPYLGRNITGWRELGLDPNKLYGMLRPLDEIMKAVDTYRNLPLTDDHITISPIKPAREKWFGMVGSNPYVDGKELKNEITVWVKKAIDEIELADETPNKGRKDLSVGYTYDLEVSNGIFEGQEYDFIMRNIRANHVALVREGRVEGAQVADSKTTKGLKIMKVNLTKLLKGIFASDAKDSKAADEGMKEVAKHVVSMARDSDYEGKEDMLLDEITNVLKELKTVQREEKAADNAEEKKKTEDNAEEKKKAEDEAEEKKKAEDEAEEKKKAEDEAEEKKKAEDEAEEKKKAEANDSASHYAEVIGMAQKVAGRLSNELISQGKSEVIIDSILKSRKVAFDGKTYIDKYNMLKSLSVNTQKATVPVMKAFDSKSNSANSTRSVMFNPLNRKGK